MQYNSIISAISAISLKLVFDDRSLAKYMSLLSIERSSLSRDCSPFMSYYLESILFKDTITEYIYICLT